MGLRANERRTVLLLKNLLFVGVVGGGVLGLGFNLLPPRKPDRLTEYQSQTESDTTIQSTVKNLDSSFRQQWTSNGIQPTMPASELLQARRLALGLMGAIPSLEEIRQFEALPEGQRIPWYIDHILKDSRFNEYFAERLARSYVGTEDGPFLLYRRRRFVTWLSEQIGGHRPYDQIVRDLIADNGLWTDHPATNFISVTAQQDKKNQPDPVRLAGRVNRAFLGVRLDCAQCHDHPFVSKWKQSHFQGFSAYFGQTDIGFTGIHERAGVEYEVDDKKKEIKYIVAPMVPFAEELMPRDGTRRERLAAWVTHPKNPFFSQAIVNRVWALVFGKPLVSPVDSLDTAESIPPALTILADDFAAHGFDVRR